MAAAQQPGVRPNASRSVLLFSAAAGFLLWIVLVAGLPTQEAFLGALCAFASAVFTFFLWRAQPDHLVFRLRDVLLIRHVPAQIAGDACLVTRILFRDLFGIRPAESLYRVHTFDAASPLSLAREVLATAYMTASPNSIVLGTEPERNLLLVHQLAETALPAMVRSLGAGDAP